MNLINKNWNSTSVSSNSLLSKSQCFSAMFNYQRVTTCAVMNHCRGNPLKGLIEQGYLAVNRMILQVPSAPFKHD